MALPETLLNRVEIVSVGNALDGPDVRSIDLNRKHGTGLDRPPVNDDGACSAVAGIAPDVGPGQREILTKVMNKKRPGFDVVVMIYSVDRDADFQRTTLRPVLLTVRHS